MRLVFENNDGKVVRTFNFTSGRAHVVQRADTRRLELIPDLSSLIEKNIKFKDLGSVRAEDLSSSGFKIAGLGQLRLIESVNQIQKNIQLSNDDSEKVWKISASVGLVLLFLLSFFVSRPVIVSQKLEQELKQSVVKITQRIKIQPKVQTTSVSQLQKNSQPVKPVAVKTGSIKRMGALAALGSLKNSNQKGGLDLGSIQKSAGPGLGGTQGSGGVQTNIYAKGLVAAPLGAGGNLQGAGGYGTKGKGGGQAGYGTMSLVGSSGGQSVPLANEASIDGGLDRDLIAAVINKNLGQIRFCYEQGLQGTPGLAGRVAVGFVIGASGNVTSTQIENTTLNSKVVEDCISLRLKSWKFPLPPNGAEVKVSYPFVFRRSGQG